MVPSGPVGADGGGSHLCWVVTCLRRSFTESDGTPVPLPRFRSCARAVPPPRRYRPYSRCTATARVPASYGYRSCSRAVPLRLPHRFRARAASAPAPLPRPRRFRRAAPAPYRPRAVPRPQPAVPLPFRVVPLPLPHRAHRRRSRPPPYRAMRPAPGRLGGAGRSSGGHPGRDSVWTSPTARVASVVRDSIESSPQSPPAASQSPPVHSQLRYQLTVAEIAYLPFGWSAEEWP
jgi:hypothetical protein